MVVTLKKIADIAKVSRGTVDKVLNNRPGISDETRRRVEEIAKALNYKPNIVGKALAGQRKPTLIGVIIPPVENPFFDDVKRGIDAANDEFEDFGIKIDYGIMKSISPKEQMRLINYMADKQVSGLALAAVDDQLIRDGINKLVDSGIPVVTFNTDIMNTRRMCFVGQDLVRSGMAAGELMGKLLKGNGKVAIISGSRSILAHNQRIEGFKRVIDSEFKGVEIVLVAENQDQDPLSFELTLSILEKTIDLNGIYLTGGGVSGAAKAIKVSGKRGLLNVISFDLVPETVNMVKEGIIDFTIGQDPFSQGYKPIKILYEYLFCNKTPDAEHIQTKIDIRTKWNIDIE